LRLQALEVLCQRYWYPLYCFARKWGALPQDAQDLTQSFFAVFLEKNYVARADPGRGRFRTFLLTSFKNFLTNEWKRTQAARRGGGAQCVSFDTQSAERRYLLDRVEPETPDKVFDKTWAVSILQQAMTRLRGEYEATGKAALFESLKLRLWDDPEAVSSAELAARVDLSEAAAKMAISRLRRRFREAIRQEIEQTVADPGEVEEEMRYLLAVLRA
jgi:RNA polymerase sigma-70 factor (ECF subfamily)